MKIVQDGYLIVYVMILTFVTMFIGLSVLSVSGTQYTHVVDDVYRQGAAYGAKACVSVVLDRLADDSEFSGFPNDDKEVIFSDMNSSGGEVTCTAAVGEGASLPDTKDVYISSAMYRYPSDPRPLEYEIKAIVQHQDGGDTTIGSDELLRGGVLVGHNGFYVPVFGVVSTNQFNVLGKLYGASGWNNVGTSSNPIPEINVSNIACGSSADWPQPCTTQPIESWYGGNIVDIHANTCAPGQTTFLDKFKSDGLSTDCPVPQSMPSFDKESFVDDMTNTINASDLLNTGPDGCVSKQTIGGFMNYYTGTEVHIPPNTRINGSLSQYRDGTTNISLGTNNACTLVFDGDSYITGDIEPIVILDISDTAADDISMVINGKLKVSTSHPSILPNSSGKLMHIISFYSNTPSCSNSDDVPSVADSSCLTNSQAQASSQVDSTTGVPLDAALDLVDSNGSYDFPGVTFYAYYGSVATGCSQIEIAAIGGQSISSGCLDMSLLSYITTTAVNPTFGEFLPSDVPSSVYKVIDIGRK